MRFIRVSLVLANLDLMNDIHMATLVKKITMFQKMDMMVKSSFAAG